MSKEDSPLPSVGRNLLTGYRAKNKPKDGKRGEMPPLPFLFLSSISLPLMLFLGLGQPLSPCIILALGIGTAPARYPWALRSSLSG